MCTPTGATWRATLASHSRSDSSIPQPYSHTPMSQTLTRTIDAAYREKFPASAKLYEQGRTLFPDGVTHDGRFLKPFPVYVEHAAGSKKYDPDGNEIIDYWMGHGSLL